MNDIQTWFVADVNPFIYNGPIKELDAITQVMVPNPDRPEENFDPTFNTYGTEVTEVDLYLQASHMTQNAMIDAAVDSALIGISGVTIALIGALIFYAFSCFWKKHQITRVSDPMGFHLIRFSRIWTIILTITILVGILLITLPTIAAEIDTAAYYSSQMSRFDTGKALWDEAQEWDRFDYVVYPD